MPTAFPVPARFLNSYTAPPLPAYPPGIHLHTPPDRYDLNFSFNAAPIQVLRGEGRLVELEPLIVRALHFQLSVSSLEADLADAARHGSVSSLQPSLHAQALFDGIGPSHFQHCPVESWTSLQDCLELLERHNRSHPETLFFAIRNLKDSDRRMAGMIAYQSADADNLTLEVGWVMIFEEFQRTHVLTHSVSLLLDHAFDLPSDGGYGVRRVQWKANDTNRPSIAAALRLGFVDEAPISLRAIRSLRPDQKGSYVGRDGDALSVKGCKVGRSSALLSITAHEWDTATKAHVHRLVHKYG